MFPPIPNVIKILHLTFFISQPHLRKAGEEALDMWHSKIGFLPLLDNEILSTAMRETNPNLRATVSYRFQSATHPCDRIRSIENFFSGS